MDTVCVVSMIILPDAEKPELESDFHEIGISDLSDINGFFRAKRFGVVDLWKIHSAKRYANVYPRRV
ncbi:MAG: hypothetical protein ACO25B_08425 [Chitinophagaceae bacterium]